MTTRRSLLLGVGGVAVLPATLGTIDRDDTTVGEPGLVAAPADTGTQPLVLDGRLRQGGFIMGRTTPGAQIRVDGEPLTTASSTGLFIVGLDRDAGASTTIEARAGSRVERQTITVAAHSFPSSRIDGLPPSTVEPTDPALLERIRREAAIKAEGFASRIEADHFSSGFIWPLETYRISSAWGAQRILNGTPARPHYGIDLAAPAGTVIRAPGDGVVTFAQTGLHFEGGLVLMDHGQGLISAYLHQSRILVQAGQFVRQGEAIGHVGRTGRATGPHLCWRMKWRDRQLDPSLLVNFNVRALT